MEKIIRKIKKGEDHANISYWLSQTYQQRMADLEAMREQIHAQYAVKQGFQRVYRVVKRS
jgi:hypothetical protein